MLSGKKFGSFSRTMVWYFCTTSSFFVPSGNFSRISLGILRTVFLEIPVLIERDRKHLAVVYFIIYFFKKGLFLTTSLLSTPHIISATYSAVCFSYWYRKIVTGAGEKPYCISTSFHHYFCF
jgi:hypothetical protein